MTATGRQGEMNRDQRSRVWVGGGGYGAVRWGVVSLLVRGLGWGGGVGGSGGDGDEGGGAARRGVGDGGLRRLRGRGGAQTAIRGGRGVGRRD